jgi:hypothetical protein
MRAHLLLSVVALYSLLTSCTREVLPSLEGCWFGGTADQLEAVLSQNKSRLNVTGWIARRGAFRGFKLGITGRGTVRPDSTLELHLSGMAGRQSFIGKLFPDGKIAGTLSGERFEDPVSLGLSWRPQCQP